MILGVAEEEVPSHTHGAPSSVLREVPSAGQAV